jgi:hypothetical protein
VTGRWQVELLPGARAGLMEILQDHGDDAFDQALNDILALEDDPTPEDAEHLRKTRDHSASTFAVHFTVPYTASFSGSESCSSSASGREVQCI